MRRWGCAAIVALAIVQPSAVFAQASNPPANGKRVFEPAFFEQYRPITALDMVNRVPGFQLNTGDGLRGFGENAGNVLIDGARPSSKSDNLNTILGRIPASQVARIELTEQAGSAADARGQGQILNIIRSGKDSVSGTYTANIEFGRHEGMAPFGDVSLSVRRGHTTYELGASHFVQFNRLHGPEYQFDGQQRLTELRRAELSNLYVESNLNGAIKARHGTTSINLNAKLTRQKEHDSRFSNFFSPVMAPVGTELLTGQDPDVQLGYELGGDVEFPMLHGLTSKIIGLYNNTHYTGGGTVDTRGTGGGDGIFATRTTVQADETIGRMQNSWAASPAHSVQFGGEAVLNRRVQQFTASSTVGGAVTQFPASNVRVQEWRFEPFVSDVWSFAPKWKLELGLIAESSSLTVSGDASAHRSLFFWKPRAIASWTISGNTNLEFRAERQVAQLNFGDFATSIDLGRGGQVNAGNRDLVPEKTWTFGGKLRHKFWSKGSVELGVAYVSVTDTQDLVPVVVRDTAGNILSRFDGPGNLGTSHRFNIDVDSTWPLDRITRPLGFTGLEFQLGVHRHIARVIDAVTGLPREASNNTTYHESFVLRQDLPKLGLAWNVKADTYSHECAYYIDQTTCFASGAEVFATIEYKKFKYGTLGVTFGNPTNVRQNLWRTYYKDTRASGLITGTNLRQRFRDMRILVSLSGKF